MQKFNSDPSVQPGHHESTVGRLVHAVGHVVAEGAHVVADTASVFLMPYSNAAEASVENATSDRREGDKVNPYTIPLDAWVNTKHRT
jgi:hypothetical protein